MHPERLAAPQPVAGDSAPGIRSRRATFLFAAVAISAAVLVGVVLRLADPLSSPVVPAEDPYTHMALVREHLRTGELDPLNSQETVYPPGLHAFLAAAWVYTGIDLYNLILLGPVLFGAIGLIGIAVLLWRTAGPAAAFVGTLAMAVAPEAIFRTTMMSPTALDLAILPFLLDALLRVLAGRLGWIGAAAPMAVFLALAHPWLLPILCAAGITFVLLSLAMPSTGKHPQPVAVSGIAACVAMLGVGAGICLMMPSFGGVLHVHRGPGLVLLGVAAALVSVALAIGAALLVRRGTVPRYLPTRVPSMIVRGILSATIALALCAVWVVAKNAGMPPLVNLPRMLGWPTLALAFAGLVALPFASSPVGRLSAGLVVVTLPFVLFNPFHSEFLSHRTAVFLGFAAVLLAGVAAGGLVHACSQALHWGATARSSGTVGKRGSATSVGNAGSAAPPARSSFPRRLLLAAPALLVATLLGGTVYAGTPDAYPGGWYRLYTPCELDALRDVARQADAEPQAILVVGDWQAKLVLAALTNDAQRVWLKSDVFTSEESRGDLVASMHHNGRPLIVVTERYLRVETPDADTSFTASQPWQPDGSWCSGMGVEQPRMAAFTTGQGAAATGAP